MPTISVFYGIAILMFVADHNPPHFHARYQGYEASFDFCGNLLDGEMPNKQCKLIAAWVEIHQNELRANWERVRYKKQPRRIEPLR